MIVGFDLDGVLFKFPFYGFFRAIKVDYFLYRCLRKIENFKKAFYSLVKIDPDIAEIIGQLAKYGHKILIISSRSYECAKEVDDCLKRNGVLFDRLLLCLKKERPSQFKLKQIKDEGCDFYVEDQWRIVRFLRESLDYCQVVHYKNQQSLTEFKKILEA